MFVCVFAKKFLALASQSCREVSRPRTIGEYEYRLFPRAFVGSSNSEYPWLFTVLLLSRDGVSFQEILGRRNLSDK